MRRVRHRGMSPFAAGLVAIAVIAIGSYFGFTKANPFADRYEIKAAFRTSNDVKPKSLVRIAGVTVGKVKKVESLRGGGSILTMELTNEGLPIKTDARMKIRPRIFLEGNFFVDVSPGSPSAPVLKEGETIPVQQTSAPVQFGQVLAALQSDTRNDLRRVLREYGRALAGEGAKGYNRSIPWQERAFKNSAIVNEAQLGTEDGDLSGYLKGASKFAEGLDRNPEQLKDLITDFAATAKAFADEDEALSRAISELPSTLQVGRRALGNLNDAFPSTRRFIADFRPAVRSSGPALDASIPLIRQLRRLVSRPELRGLVRDLRPTVPHLVELNRGGIPLQEEIRLLSSCQNEVYLPILDSRIPDANHPFPGKIYEEASRPLVGLAGESRNFDANGQYVRTESGGANYAYPINDGAFILSGAPIEGVNPPKAPNPPYRPDVPCETQEQPDLRTRVQPPPSGGIKVNQTSPAARARYEKAKEVAVRWLRGQIRREGLAGKLRVTDKDVTRSQAAAAGGKR